MPEMASQTQPLLTRDEHLAWCKQRALKHVEIDDLDGALISLHADLSAHPETATHPDQYKGMVMRLQGRLESHTAMRAHIQGYQ